MYSPPVAAWYLAKRRRRRRAASLAVDATPVETATINVAYDGFTVTPSGGTEPYRYDGYGFPAGIAIDGSGDVAGTPTESGAFPVTIRVTDIEGNFTELAFTVTVSA